MKKIILIFSFVFIFVFSLSFSVSAEERINDDLILDGASRSSPPTDVLNTTWIIDEHPTFSGSMNWGVSFISNGVQFDHLRVLADNGRISYRFYNDADYIDVYDSGTWLDSSYRVVYFTGGGTTDAYPLSVLSSIASPSNEPFNVDVGVGAAIGFSSEVLDFIVSTEGILAFLGLSIALTLIVPFAITKLKELVKGY